MKILDTIRDILSVTAVLVLAAGALCFVSGLKPAVVMSPSMEPAFRTGSVVFVKMGSSYEIGDAVAFHHGGTYVTHRLVRKENGMYVTKGDSNYMEDPGLITPEDIDGRIVLCIPWLGYAIRFAAGRQGIIAILSVIICLILSGFITYDEDEKKAGRIKRARQERI